MNVKEIKVAKIEHKVSPCEKKIIYDFGDDIEDYRYLVEDWKCNKYGKWHRVHMYWPHAQSLVEAVL